MIMTSTAEIQFWVLWVLPFIGGAVGYFAGFISYSSKIEALEDDIESLAEENIELYNELNAIKKGDLNGDGKTTTADLSAFMKRYNVNRT